ncbi:MAG: hypothetical protein ACFFHV_21410 [Promethearchaeota archaeon]
MPLLPLYLDGKILSRKGGSSQMQIEIDLSPCATGVTKNAENC